MDLVMLLTSDWCIVWYRCVDSGVAKRRPTSTATATTRSCRNSSCATPDLNGTAVAVAAAATVAAAAAATVAATKEAFVQSGSGNRNQVCPK